MRAFAFAAALAAALMLAAAAQADVGLTLTTLSVRSGGLLRGHGNAVGMPVYLVPERLAPRPHSCHGGTAFCRPRSWKPPGKPYVFLGRMPGRFGRHTVRDVRFAFRVPSVRPGRYQVVFWCRPCGRALILAGATLHGQVVRVTG